MQVGNPPARPATLVGPPSRHPTVPSNPPTDNDIITALNYVHHTHFEAQHGTTAAGVRRFVDALQYFQELVWYRMNHALVAGNNVPQWAQNMRNTLTQRITAAGQTTNNKLQDLQDTTTVIRRIAARAYNGAQGHGGGYHRYAIVAFANGSLPTDDINGPLPALHSTEDIANLSVADLRAYLLGYGYNNGTLPQGQPARRGALRDAIGSHAHI
ncbi:hypothetical protein GGF50DRAFT_54074 [Schizophyllum commune]